MVATARTSPRWILAIGHTEPLRFAIKLASSIKHSYTKVRRPCGGELSRLKKSSGIRPQPYAREGGVSGGYGPRHARIYLEDGCGVMFPYHISACKRRPIAGLIRGRIASNDEPLPIGIHDEGEMCIFSVPCAKLVASSTSGIPWLVKIHAHLFAIT